MTTQFDADRQVKQTPKEKEKEKRAGDMIGMNDQRAKFFSIIKQRLFNLNWPCSFEKNPHAKQVKET